MFRSSRVTYIDINTCGRVRLIVFCPFGPKKNPEGKPPGPPLGQAEKLAILGFSSVTHRAPTKDGVDRKGDWEAG